MNKILCLLILSSLSIYSQKQINNFEIEDGTNIVYKRVFEMKENSKEEIVSFFQSLSNVQISDVSDELIGEIEDMNINYKKYGGKYMNTLILLNQKMNSKIKVQFKDDKYRIILRDIKFYDDVSLNSLSTLKESDNITHFSDFMVKKKKGEFRTSKILLKGLEYMDLYFNDFFTYKESKSDDYW